MYPKIINDYLNNKCDLSSVDLTDADLTCVNLFRANLSDANLSGADLSSASLSGANLSGADLSSASLSGANLFGADLSAATLISANLSGADLSAATLISANLSEADLSGATLTGANLDGVNLDRVDFRYAHLPSPTILLLADWGEVSDELCVDLMRFDASTHPNPETFDRWASTGDCPYNNFKSQTTFRRAVNFRQKRHLWSPGDPPPIRDLIFRLFEEKNIKY